MAAERVKKGATGKRIEVEITLPADISPCRAAFRIANSHGVSNPVYIGLDELNQLPFGPEIAEMPVALHGNLSGDTKLQTHFQGKKGQHLVIEIEARRLGANFDPVITLLDPRKIQAAWAQGRTALGGDARLETVLKADGTYTIELHDVLYRAGSPNQFRLKVGDLHYADLAFPLGMERGKEGQFELIGNIPAEKAHVRLAPSSEPGDRACLCLPCRE